MRKVTTERLEESKKCVEEYISMFTDGDMEQDKGFYCTFQPSELVQISQIIDELLSHRNSAAAGDEEVGYVQRLCNSIRHEARPCTPKLIDDLYLLGQRAGRVDDLCQQLREANSEIERLKEREAAAAESLRLERSVTDQQHQSQISTLTAERDEARKEVEQLRMAVGCATTIKGDMVMRADDPIGMMQEVCSYVAALKSCPEMGEVEFLESMFGGCVIADQHIHFDSACDLARRAIASHATEKQRADEVTHLLRRMLGAVITVRLENTPEWMEYMAEVVNEMNAAIGEADRVETHGDGIRILAICGKEVG